MSPRHGSTLTFHYLLAGALMLLPCPAFAESPSPAAEASPALEQLFHRAETLNENWEENKGRFKKDFEDLIEKFQKAIETRENALDYGDPAEREQIHEELKDLERARDGLKRRLAEEFAAHLVDLSKTKEAVNERIEDWKD